MRNGGYGYIRECYQAMVTDERTFTVATDDAVTAMIQSARRRLVVIAPALSQAVADALADRIDELADLDVRVIVDADAEVYRLGFGEREALQVIRETASRSLLDLREQPGVRIGVIISDEDTMVFAPVSKNIEAGSDTAEKPNAIVLRGRPSESLARAAGAERSDDSPTGEIGGAALDPQKVEAMQAELQRNPPAKFDIARRLNVFTSRVVYVEFEIKNFALGRRGVPLPDDFKTATTKALQAQISSRLRAPMAEIGAVEVVVGEGENTKTEKIDDEWLRKERKRIEDLYTFQIDNFGRVILREDRQAFDKAVNAFTTVVSAWLKNPCFPTLSSAGTGALRVPPVAGSAISTDFTRLAPVRHRNPAFRAGLRRPRSCGTHPSVGFGGIGRVRPPVCAEARSADAPGAGGQARSGAGSPQGPTGQRSARNRRRPWSGPGRGPAAQDC